MPVERHPLRSLLLAALGIAASSALFAGAALREGSLVQTLRQDPSEKAAPDRPARARVVDAVTLFHRIYQDFFASSGQPALIDEMPASRDFKHHVFRDIGFLQDAGVVLVQDLASAQVIEVEHTGPHTAQLTQYEEWNYVLQDAAERRPLSQIKGLGQGFRYDLVEDDGRWIIVGWDLADVKPPPAGRSRTW